MSTTLQFDPAADWKIDGKITLTYEGASPTDTGPAGALMRMMIAQLSQDKEALKAAVTENTIASMGEPTSPGKDLNVKVKEAQFEGDDKNTAIVPADLLVDGQPQELPFVIVKEESGWKVDMQATMQKLLGGSMEMLTTALEEGMKQMAEGMQGVMEGMGEAMSQAFNGSGESAEALDAVPSHPDLAAFRQKLIDHLGLHWTVKADEDAFAVSSPELLQDVLSALFSGIVDVGATNDSATAMLNKVREIEFQKDRGFKRLEREFDKLIYNVGETDDGRGDYFHSGESSAALTSALDGIL
jgi:hypothetical protein